MGNSNTTSSKAAMENNLLSFFVLNCENGNEFRNDVDKKEILKYQKHKLSVTIKYNGNEKSISCDYYKNSVWNKGVIQHPLVSNVNSCTIALGCSTSKKAPKYREIEFEFGQYQEGQVISLQFFKEGSTQEEQQQEYTQDGADEVPMETTSGGNGHPTTLNIIFTKNLLNLKNEVNSIIKETRNSDSHYSFLFPFEDDDFDNGDIILYSGSSPVSEIIRDRFCRPWSHVGIVVKTYPFINQIKGQELSEEPVLYVMESTGKEGIKDPFRKTQSLTGVNIFPLRDRIKEYGGYNVQAIRLNTPFNQRQKERWLTNCFEMHGARVPFDVFQGAVLLLERLRQWNQVSDKSVFCSELAAICLFRAGVLDDDENYPANTDPGEVSEFKCFKGSRIRFLKYDI
ncbi:hypothetical protein DICPUDRAFT_80808 [Dictyostelium purpureum]|uniref:Uncharacterized protein n=1 Tax=Dictyostelium purpureum TaxID=5786 RepID=F0ZRL2_DICPU|nr:uncharacterized protein DICPUDRAFT_80808 [Dictyostelium purpureum]EGC33426.1 hypothetical protein DICPUDRAFT_80808 [Dictyostelium purpureum]|eukprot:XP_003290045.1 hypothetical protein DICPUDRAFT_80808 [Dictyostelium purpureum]